MSSVFLLTYFRSFTSRYCPVLDYKTINVILWLLQSKAVYIYGEICCLCYKEDEESQPGSNMNMQVEGSLEQAVTYMANRFIAEVKVIHYIHSQLVICRVEIWGWKLAGPQWRDNSFIRNWPWLCLKKKKTSIKNFSIFFFVIILENVNTKSKCSWTIRPWDLENVYCGISWKLNHEIYSDSLRWVGW